MIPQKALLRVNRTSVARDEGRIHAANQFLTTRHSSGLRHHLAGLSNPDNLAGFDGLIEFNGHCSAADEGVRRDGVCDEPQDRAAAANQ